MHKFVSLHIIFPIRPYYSYEKENFPSGFSQTLQTGADSHSRYRVTFRILLFCSLPHWLSVGGSDFFLQRRYVPQPRISLWSLASGLWHRCGGIFPAAFFPGKKETPPSHDLPNHRLAWNGIGTRDRMAFRYRMAPPLLGLQKLFSSIPWLYLPVVRHRIWRCGRFMDLYFFRSSGKFLVFSPPQFPHGF